MAEAGIRAVEKAKANGAWTEYDEIEDMVMPPDLLSALESGGDALAFFERFPDSSRKNILWWIKSTRRPETRADRISRTVELAAENRMANHPQGRDRGPAR